MMPRKIDSSDFRIVPPVDLAEDEVQLWQADLEAIRAGEEYWRQTLSPDELSRAARFHFARDRQCFIATRSCLRLILAAYLDIAPGELKFRYSTKEKPSLDDHKGRDIRFNVSHSGGIALLAFSAGRDVGVDVEQIRLNSDLDAIAARFFSEAENAALAQLAGEEKAEAFFRCWTRKEAYIKATGDGLSLPLRQFDVSLAGNDGDALLQTRPDPAEAGRWRMKDIPLQPGYAAAVCAGGRDWKLVAP